MYWFQFSLEKGLVNEYLKLLFKILPEVLSKEASFLCFVRCVDQKFPPHDSGVGTLFKAKCSHFGM